VIQPYSIPIIQQISDELKKNLTIEEKLCFFQAYIHDHLMKYTLHTNDDEYMLVLYDGSTTHICEALVT
jgi:hypothetical protein